jgi:uncharacterized protein YpmB
VLGNASKVTSSSNEKDNNREVWVEDDDDKVNSD